MNKIYVVAAADYGDTCDGHARILGAFKSEEEAKNYVRNDIEEYFDMNFAGEPRMSVDFDKMEICSDGDIVCGWTINGVEVR